MATTCSLVPVTFGLASATSSSGFHGNDTGTGEEQPPRYWAVTLLVFPVLTVFGNVLVCLSIYRERGLHTVTNFFIFSLAVADVMVAILVMPLAVYVEVNNSIWRLGDTLCDTWVAFDVMCCTSSILNLTAISLDRFIAVTRPIQYAKHKNSRRIRLTLALTWIVSLAVSLPVAVGINYTDRRTRTPWLCTFYNADFLIFSSMASFYIPCVLMILLYWRIFRAIRLRAADRKSSSARKSVPEVVTSSTTATRSSSIRFFRAELSSSSPRRSNSRVRSSLCETPPASSSPGELLLPVARVAPRRVSVRMTKMAAEPHRRRRTTVYDTIRLNSDPTDEEGQRSSARGHGGVNNSTSSDDLDAYAAVQSDDVGCGGGGGHVIVVDDDVLPASDGDVERRRRKSSARQLAVRMRRRTVMSFATKAKSKQERASTKRREKKATKTLAVVLGVFLFCWVPFFTINIVNAVCIRYDLFSTSSVCNISPMAFAVFVWLGYFNSFLNPLIYTIFNVEFRKAFKKILTQPCQHGGTH